ncbi:beta-galactosidase [soil metagenome]
MKDDADRMVEAGVNVVRMAEFAWDLMEPRSGDFHFEVFDEVIERLGQRGIETILCTPTATPPRWLTVQHEDWMRLDSDGRRMVHGSRQQCCTTNPEFRRQSERITQVMAAHFGSNPHVIGWQTDNELHCQISECYCPACVVAFRLWLANKYREIGAVNAAWGTAFWSQTYANFEEVGLPLRSRPTHPNPSQLLDYYRFLSDSMIEFQRGQTEILRETEPTWWITHNGMFGHLDYWKFTDDLDFLSIDIYPGFAPLRPQRFDWASHRLQCCRAATGSFIIPEQQGGAGGQSTFLLPTPSPGQMRLWAWQAVAHGADGILHFRWRTCRFGAEMYWNGVLDHDNIPRRRFREFAQEGGEFRRLGDIILGTVQDVRAGVLIQTDQEEAHATMSQGLPGPEEQSKLALRELLVRHLPAGLVHVEDSFEGLDLIVMPSFVLMDEVLAEKLRTFVQRGGTLVANARTATRDRRNHVFAHSPPGMLGEVFGATVEEFGTIIESSVRLEADGQSIAGGGGYEIIQAGNAEILARWSESEDHSPHAATGAGAVTVNRHGAGEAIYVGTWFSEQNVSPLFDLVLPRRSIAPLAEAEECVEITRRRDSRGTLTFLLNHYGREAVVTKLTGGRELISETQCEESWTLPPFGVAVVQNAAE